MEGLGRYFPLVGCVAKKIVEILFELRLYILPYSYISSFSGGFALDFFKFVLSST